MQSFGPYRLLRTLGTCQVGSVWAAVDADGNQVALAVLDAMVASDPRWREAFSATANAQAQDGMLRAIQADFTANAPWVAVEAGPGPGAAQIFTALGQEYHGIAPAPAEPDPGPTTPTVATDTGGAPASTPQTPGPVAPSPPRPISPGLISPASVSAGPASGAGITSGGPVSGAGQWGGPEPDAPRTEPASRRRAAVIVGVVALIALIPGAGGAVIASTLRPPGSTTPSGSSLSPFASQPSPSRSPWVLVTPAPAQPGVEPTGVSPWPSWPRLSSTDRKRLMETQGLSFFLPESWRCVSTRPSGLVRFTCESVVGVSAITADILIRECPFPCDKARRVYLRGFEEALGLQWKDSSAFTTWVDREASPRYDLIMIVYGRTVDEGILNRQVVVRITASIERKDEVRKAANAIRDGIS